MRSFLLISIILLCVGCSGGGNEPTAQQIQQANDAEFGIVKQKLQELRKLADNPQSFVPEPGANEPPEFTMRLNAVASTVEGFVNSNSEPKEPIKQLHEAMSAVQKSAPKAQSTDLNRKLEELIGLASKLPGTPPK